MDERTGLVVEGMTLGELKDVVASQYDLDDDIKERLVLRYYVGSREEGNRKPKYIIDNDSELPGEDIMRLDGYNLMVRYNGKKQGERGDERVVDVSCDSTYMQDAMPKVGEAIREAYNWVPMDYPIFLFLDNAGGHGTNAVVDEYVAMLEEVYNVVCIHQRPRSPAINLLVLGVWMALQSVVERMHFHKHKEAAALAATVEMSWEALEPIKLVNVYKRWKKVLKLIIEDEGGDRLVESKRVKLFSAPSGDVDFPDEEEGDS